MGSLDRSSGPFFCVISEPRLRGGPQGAGGAGAAVFGPALVIALGAALLVASVRRRDEAPAAYAAPAAPAVPAEPVAAAQAVDAQAFDTAMAAPTATVGYDTDATASVDLGAAEPTDPNRETETK